MVSPQEEKGLARGYVYLVFIISLHRFTIRHKEDPIRKYFINCPVLCVALTSSNDGFRRTTVTGRFNSQL